MGAALSRFVHVVAVLGCLILCLAPTAAAFDTSAHVEINRAAVRGSTMDAVLRNGLGFLLGVDTPLIDARGPRDWIGLGGRAEDMWLGGEIFGGLTRSTNHFHTPRRSWDTAGLAGAESSVRWAQDPNQSPGGRASWLDARAAFHRALTSAGLGERQRAFANAFQIIGQVMHLITDMASVPHTRNDVHPLGDGFETFMADPLNRGFITGFIPPDPGLTRVATGDAIARVPIARLWDADRYDGSNPPDDATGASFGLAEFTSANFFSDDSITAHAFTDADLPLPALDRLVPGPVEVYPPSGKPRQYLSKPGDGVPITHMVAEGVFFQYTPPFIALHTLDDLVFADYAPRLLPRAIGYASALIDYFFRGRIEIAPPARYAYGLAGWVPGNAGAFTSLTFKVRNATPNEDTGAGQLTAVVRYRRSTGGDVLATPGAPLGPEIFAVSAPQAVTLGAGFQELTFDFSANPIPTNSADLFLTVVYRGPLGLEEDAVAVGGKDLREPDPFDRANITDYDCFNGSPIQVASSAGILPPYSAATPQRDVDGNGVQDLFGPWTERGVYLKTFDLAGPTASAGPGNFDENVPEFDFAQFTRFMILQDRDVYGMALLRQQLSEFSTGAPFFNLREAAPIQGPVNRLFEFDGLIIHEFDLSFVYRGLTTYRIFLLLSSPAMNDCLVGSDTLPPPLTQSPDTVAN